MVEIPKPNSEAEKEKFLIDQELKLGYEHLQLWWEILLDNLPDKRILRHLVEGTKLIDDLQRGHFGLPCENISLTTILKSPLGMESLWMPPRGYDPEDDEPYLYYEVIASVLDSRHIIKITPAELDQRENGTRVSPPWYPIYRLETEVGEDFYLLKHLSVRHRALRQKEKLFCTDIDLSTETQKIIHLYQEVKDETFFARTKPRYTKGKPHQFFSLKLKEDGVNCRFDYKGEGQADTMPLWKLEWLSKLGKTSYIPYPGFDILKAIRNVCAFKPAIESPSI